MLRGFWRREGELIDAGDIAGAVELNVATWLGPEASQATRERVRLMQRRALEVQLAAPEQYEPADVAVVLGAITAPSLIVSGGKDLPDFRLIAARLTAMLPGARPVELPWAGHLPTLERPQELSALLTAFLRETVPAALGISDGSSQETGPPPIEAVSKPTVVDRPQARDVIVNVMNVQRDQFPAH